MTAAAERQFTVQAWAASVTVHGMAVTLALLFVSHIKPPRLPEVFEWTVSLVEAPPEEAVEPPEQAATPPAPAPLPPQVEPMQPATTTPRTVTQEVHTQPLNPVVQREQPQPTVAAKAIERPPVETIEQAAVVRNRQTVTEVVEQAQEASSIQEAQAIERAPGAVVQSAAPVEMPTRTETYVPSLPSAAAVDRPKVEQIASTPAGKTESAVESSVEARSIETVAMPMTHTQTEASALPSVTTVDTPKVEQIASIPVQKMESAVESRVEAPQIEAAAMPRESVVSQQSTVEPVKPVTRSVHQAPAARADYGWLAESIGRRLSELKRYPPTARLNGWEGKVVLRAVIRADGNLVEVKVQKSSGHEALDEAAMESMRQACPIHMRHELGRPHIVVNVPVVYALSN